jgi:hypothetical protein
MNRFDVLIIKVIFLKIKKYYFDVFLKKILWKTTVTIF